MAPSFKKLNGSSRRQGNLKPSLTKIVSMVNLSVKLKKARLSSDKFFEQKIFQLHVSLFPLISLMSKMFHYLSINNLPLIKQIFLHKTL